MGDSPRSLRDNTPCGYPARPGFALVKGKLGALRERQDSLARCHGEPLAALLGRENDDSLTSIKRIALRVGLSSSAYRLSDEHRAGLVILVLRGLEPDPLNARFAATARNEAAPGSKNRHHKQYL